MKKFLFILCLIFATTSFAWDFLLSDGTWTRRGNPFEIKENRIYRTQEELPAKARFDDNNQLIVFTTFEDNEYVCVDGTVPVPEDAPKRISILRLVLAIRSAGLSDQFNAWLEASGYKELFYIAQEFTTDNEYFEEGRASARDALGLTDEQVDAIIQAAVLSSR